MEAPVPASSLIHSATLVSAGIYLVLRFNHFFDSTEFGKFIIPIVGSVTASYGGVCAAAQTDLKKILAYSTISHCGFLMILCTVNMDEFVILYLYVHGFFKAGVFMCIGNILRITKGCQDSRKMGGLLKYLPFEYFCITIGMLNLAGLPFTFGFCTKHLLFINLGTSTHIYTFVMFHSLLGAFSGVFYSFRLINYTFNDFKKGPKLVYSNTLKNNYNSPIYSNSSLAATLAICSLYLIAYIIVYLMLNYLICNNYIFSDFINNTLLTNYYAALSSFDGFLLNFFYINVAVCLITIYLLFSKFRKSPRLYIIIYSTAIFMYALILTLILTQLF
jgi:NADH:ubiquinone oxidoreductase subunit 5 (subunit L)/multisubunit Na+/H+ antiporter MnhA subunit